MRPVHLGLTNPDSVHQLRKYIDFSKHRLTARQEMKCKGCFDILRSHRHHDGMSCVVSSSTSRTNVYFGRENVDQFAFAFIAPLRTQHYRHYIQGLIIRINAESPSQRTETYHSWSRTMFRSTLRCKSDAGSNAERQINKVQ